MRRIFPYLVCLAGWLGGLPAWVPARGADVPEESVTINYPNSPASDILSFYEKLTGKVLVRDANLAGALLNIVATQPLPKSQAIRLIEAALLLNGYALVPDGDNRVKVLNATSGKNPRSEGIPLYANATAIPEGNEVVSYFMQLSFLAAPDAQTIFSQHVPLHVPYGSIVQVPNAQALVITENASLIRQLINLKELIDVPPARVISEFVALQRADAERVAEIINKLIEKKQGAYSASAPGQPRGAPGNPISPVGAGAANELFENNLVTGSVQLVPDPRTNRILVITRPVNFSYIKNLIADFDEAVGLGASMERPLKYISAAEVLPVLQDLLSENEKKEGQGATPGTVQNPQSNRPQNNPYGTTGSGQNSSREFQEIFNTPEDRGPLSVIVGKTRLIADNKANSILIIGSPESQEKVRAILDILDKRPQQVYLAAVIGTLTLNNSQEFGVDYLKLFQSGSLVRGSNGSITGSTATHNNGLGASLINSAATSLIDPRILTTAAAFPPASGLALYGTIGKDLSVFVHALESTNRFKVLARPIVYTANNKKAMISSGQRIAFPSSTLSNVNNVNNINNVNNAFGSTAAVASNIEYQDVSLALEVVPLINANNEVNLQIQQKDDNVTGSQTIAGNTVPTISTQKIVTTVTVPSGATVVLGGLITENVTNDISGIPVLSKLPWVGGLFRDTKKNKTRNELIVLIQPTVVSSNREMVDTSVQEADHTEVGNAAYDFAEPPLPKSVLVEPFLPKHPSKSAQ